MRFRPVFSLLLGLAALIALATWVFRSASQTGRTQPQTVGAPTPTPTPTPAPATVPQGHVYTGAAEEPDNVNPFTAHSSVAWRFVLTLTHDGLLDIDPATGSLRPALAESYQMDTDGSGCTFTLRDGVEFADGAPLTMADVLFSWKIAAAGHVVLGTVRDAFSRVADAQALDQRRLHVRFRDRHFARLQSVGVHWLVAQRKFFCDRVAEHAARLAQPVPEVGTREFGMLLAQITHECGPGTGPYQLHNPPQGGGTWLRGRELTIVRNDRSWRRRVRPDTWNFDGFRLLFGRNATPILNVTDKVVDWQVVGDPHAELAARPALAEDYEALAYDYQTLGVYRLAWNCGRAPFDDIRVRRAVAALFDRNAVMVRYPHHLGVAEALFKPDSPAYPTTPGIAFDPEAARLQLKELGFDAAAGKPLHLVLLAPGGPPEMTMIVTGLQQAARDAGVVLELRQYGFGGLVAERQRGGWDGEIMLQSLRASGDVFDVFATNGTDNISGYSNATVDRLAAAAREEQDVARRNELWRELNTIVQREQPMTFLLHPRVPLLHNRHIALAVPGRLGMNPERCWVPPEFQRR